MVQVHNCCSDLSTLSIRLLSLDPFKLTCKLLAPHFWWVRQPDQRMHASLAQHENLLEGQSIIHISDVNMLSILYPCPLEPLHHACLLQCHPFSSASHACCARRRLGRELTRQQALSNKCSLHAWRCMLRFMKKVKSSDVCLAASLTYIVVPTSWSLQASK